MALANTSRTEPAFPFDQGRGYLALPAAGVKVVDYGASDGFGGISSGISLRDPRRRRRSSRPPMAGCSIRALTSIMAKSSFSIRARATPSCWPGWTRSNVRYRPVRAHGRADRHHGHHDNWSSAVATSAGVSRPTLYIELRKDNEPDRSDRMVGHPGHPNTEWIDPDASLSPVRGRRPGAIVAGAFAVRAAIWRRTPQRGYRRSSPARDRGDLFRPEAVR